MNSVNIYKSFFKNYTLSINDSMYLFLNNNNDDNHIFSGLNTVFTPIGINYNEVSQFVYKVDMSLKVRVCKEDKTLVGVDATLGNYVYMGAENHHEFINQLYLIILPDVYKILISKINNNLVKSNLNKINFPDINFKNYYNNALKYLESIESQSNNLPENFNNINNQPVEINS